MRIGERRADKEGATYRTREISGGGSPACSRRGFQIMLDVTLEKPLCSDFKLEFETWNRALKPYLENVETVVLST